MIIKAAILKDNIVYTDIRHHLIIWAHPKKFFNGEDCIQGFITDEGKFVNRDEALIIARDCGQVDKIIGSKLTSEDLWDIKGKFKGDDT